MNGDPQDPIRFDMASRKLWERLVAREGVNLRQHQLSGVDATSREWRELDERLQHLRGDAQTMLLGYITVGPARWWTWDGERFRRPPPEALAMRFATTASDEPWNVYVDWSEIEAAIAICNPELTAPVSASVSSKAPEKSDLPVRLGRPPRSGAYPDDQFLDKMAELLDAGAVTSIKKAAETVAKEEPEIPGASDESTVKRLSRKFREREKGA